MSGKPPPLKPPSYLPPHGGEKLGRELIVALPQREGEKGEGEKGEGEQKGFSFESE